jgi:hypothetical protein
VGVEAAMMPWAVLANATGPYVTLEYVTGVFVGGEADLPPHATSETVAKAAVATDTTRAMEKFVMNRNPARSVFWPPHK